MKKKRIKFVLAFVFVLVAVFASVLNCFAEQVGAEPYSTATSLQSYFGTAYNGNISVDNLYTFCIDIGALTTCILNNRVDDMYVNFLSMEVELESASDIVTLNIEVWSWSYVNTVVTIWINETEVYSFTGQECADYGGSGESDYVLIPFNIWDGVYIVDTPWITPSPVYQIFNNLQLSNTRTYASGYNTGFNLGHEQGYSEGYLQGQQDSTELGESGAQLITAVVEAPVNVFTRLLDFNILGINVLGIVVALLSFALVIAILKKVI